MPRLLERRIELSSNPSAPPAGPPKSGPIDPNDPDIESDTEQWELDDEAQALTEEQSPAPGVPKGNLAGPVSIEKLVYAFVAKHPSGVEATLPRHSIAASSRKSWERIRQGVCAASGRGWN